MLRRLDNSVDSRGRMHDTKLSSMQEEVTKITQGIAEQQVTGERRLSVIDDQLSAVRDVQSNVSSLLELLHQRRTLDGNAIRNVHDSLVDIEHKFMQSLDGLGQKLNGTETND
jgi:hypothetical protein